MREQKQGCGIFSPAGYLSTAGGPPLLSGRSVPSRMQAQCLKSASTPSEAGTLSFKPYLIDVLSGFWKCIPYSYLCSACVCDLAVRRMQNVVKLERVNVVR